MEHFQKKIFSAVRHVCFDHMRDREFWGTFNSPFSLSLGYTGRVKLFVTIHNNLSSWWAHNKHAACCQVGPAFREISERHQILIE